MQLSTVLQILNVLFLAIFGAAGWRMVNEWRKSREERHLAELAIREQKFESCKAEIESLKTTHRHELEKSNLQMTRLLDDNQKLSQNRDERILLLEQLVALLKAQAPADVKANFDALKKLNAEQLAVHEKKLQECQSTLAEEQSEHQATLKLKDSLIERLKTDLSNVAASEGFGVGLQSVLSAPNYFQLERLDSDREEIRGLIAKGGAYPSRLIGALGHWDCDVREMAAKELVSRREEVLPQLIGRLDCFGLVDIVLVVVGWLVGPPIQRLTMISQVLGAIGDPAVPQLEKLLFNKRKTPRIRAITTLRRIDTKQANEVLEHHDRIVKQVETGQLT
jgi:hypothetical protein